MNITDMFLRIRAQQSGRLQSTRPTSQKSLNPKTFALQESLNPKNQFVALFHVYNQHYKNLLQQ